MYAANVDDNDEQVIICDNKMSHIDDDQMNQFCFLIYEWNVHASIQ